MIARAVFVWALGGVIVLAGTSLLPGCKLFQNPAANAEMTYTGELLACTASAKAADAGLAGSKACECDVKKKWGVPCS